MSKLREAAQAAPDAEVRAQHKEFARWFLELGDKSALASEYLAWLAWKAALAHPPRNEWREAAEEALRWMEHARLHLTIKERMHPDGLSLYDSAAEALRAALAQPEPEAPRDEWRPASEPPDTTRSVLIWLRFGDVETFGKTLGGPSGFAFQNGAITHWRDVSPPAENQR